MVKNIDIEQIGRYRGEFLQRMEEIDALNLDDEAKEEEKQSEFNFFRMLVMRDNDVKNRFHFEAKRKTVLDGKSPIFKNWQEHSTITVDDFLEALAWVCDDPKNGGSRKCKLTREMALTPTGIKKLKIVYGNGEFGESFEIDTGKRWDGEFFEQDCDKNFVETGKIKLIQKICINAQTDLR